MALGLCAVAVCAAAASFTSIGDASSPVPVGRDLATLDTTAGRARYEADCAACHGYTGDGLVGAYPPLAAVVPELLGVDGGRWYLVRVLLHGLSGDVNVAGRSYDGLMPSFGHLGDQELALVLNHVATAWGNRELLPVGEREFTALEVALARGGPVDQSQLSSAREQLAQALAQ